MARNWKNSVPQTEATTFTFASSVFILLLWVGAEARVFVLIPMSKIYKQMPVILYVYIQLLHPLSRDRFDFVSRNFTIVLGAVYVQCYIKLVLYVPNGSYFEKKSCMTNHKK